MADAPAPEYFINSTTMLEITTEQPTSVRPMMVKQTCQQEKSITCKICEQINWFKKLRTTKKEVIFYRTKVESVRGHLQMF